MIKYILFSIALVGCSYPSVQKPTDAPLGTAVMETWAEPLTEEFVVDGKKCRAWQIVRGKVINGKRWYGNNYAVEKFVNCR